MDHRHSQTFGARLPRPAPTESARRSRIRTVDGLRGLAALLVIFDHTVGTSWGLGPWTQQPHGITLFAVLTGFLLSGRFLRARLDRGRGRSTTSFLRARVARVFPGYWAALAIAALTIGLHETDPHDIPQILTLTQTFGTDTPFEGLPPTWSLSLFLTFYLALPAWAWARRRVDPPGLPPVSVLRREVAWLLALLPLAWLVRTTSATDPISPDPAFTLLGRVDWFAIGMILAALAIAQARGIAPRLALLPGRHPGISALLALAMTTAAAIIPGHLDELRDQLDTFATGLLVAAATFHGETLRSIQRVLASRPARALGRWSFGIFLWGFIVMEAIEQAVPTIPTAPHLVATIAGAIALGGASWHFVEEPVGRRLRGGARKAEPEPGRSRPVRRWTRHRVALLVPARSKASEARTPAG